MSLSILSSSNTSASCAQISPREQNRDQAGLAILKLSIPVENVGLSNSEVQFVREKVGGYMAGISSDLFCLHF